MVLRGLIILAAVACVAGAGEVREGAMEPLAKKSYEAAALTRDFAPEFRDANKKLVFGIACPPGTVHAGEIMYSRWASLQLPAKVPEGAGPKVEGRADFFTYDAPAAGTAEWHLNFAHSDLFAFYGGPLLAQDELQVLEHPLLGSLRQALLHDGLSTLTVEGGKATPILIQGAPRRVQLATDANAVAGRPRGLYGNAFSRASAEAMRNAATRIDPPTITNIIAIEAPPGGHGNYTAEQIRGILVTATSGFMAARAASTDGKDPAPRVIIHTGFWGCGAYGGNRTLMTVLQLLAARLARVDAVVYHTGDKAGLQEFEAAQKILDETLGQTSDTEGIIGRLAARGFAWGEGDGN